MNASKVQSLRFPPGRNRKGIPTTNNISLLLFSFFVFLYDKVAICKICRGCEAIIVIAVLRAGNLQSS